MKIKEIIRALAVTFSSGFIFGCALGATVYESWEIDLRISAVWGLAFLIVFWLFDYGKWIIRQKESLRKGEIKEILDDLSREISRLKNKITKLSLDGSEGSVALAGVYIDRVIELEKIKDRLESGSIHKERIEDWTTSNKTQK